MRNICGLLFFIGCLTFGCGNSVSEAKISGLSGSSVTGEASSISPTAVQPKTITITSPSGARGFATSSAALRLDGIASEGIDSVGWSGNGRNGSASLSVQNWSIASLPLAVGDNLITVSGSDSQGVAAESKVVITYNPAVLEVSPLQAQPSALFLNEATPVNFSISLQNGSAVDKNSVQLVQVDPATRAIIGTLGPMSGSGDDFTAQFTLTATDTQAFRVQATAGGVPILSSVLQLKAYRHLSQAELDSMVSVPDQAKVIYDQKLAQTGSRTEAQAAALSYLNGLPEVLVAAAAPDNGFGIWIVYKNETLGALLLSPSGTRGGPGLLAKAIDLLSDGNATSDSVDAFFASPFSDEFVGSEDAQPTLEILKNPSSAVNQVAAVPWQGEFKQSCNVRKLRDELRGLGVFFCATHGDALFDIANYTKVPNADGAVVDTLLKALTHYDWDYAGAQVVVLTSQFQVKGEKPGAELEADLLAGRVCVSTKGYYGVLPSFFTHYYVNNGLPLTHCIVNMSCCRSTFNESLSSAFLKAGALTYFGYNQYVASDFCLSSCTRLYQGLFNQLADNGGSQTTGQAFQPGQHDTSTPPAYFELKGARNVVVMAGKAKITEFTPSSGVAGDTVTIRGDFLGGSSSKVTFNGVAASVQSGDDARLVVKVPNSSDGAIRVEPAGNNVVAPPKNKTIAVSSGNFHFDSSVIQDPSFTLFFNDTDSRQHTTGGNFSQVNALFYNFGWGFVFPTGLEPLPKPVASFGLRNDSSLPFPVTIDLAKTAPLPQDGVPTNMVCLPSSVTLQSGVRSHFDIRFESTNGFPINPDPTVANRYNFQVTIRLNSPAFGFPVQLGSITAGATDY